MARGKMTWLDWLRVAFGAFMVLVYMGMAALLAVNFFNWDATPTMTWARWGMAAVFAAYGIYRGYRQVTGQDYYRVRDLEDRYGTYADLDSEQQNDNNAR